MITKLEFVDVETGHRFLSVKFDWTPRPFFIRDDELTQILKFIDGREPDQKTGAKTCPECGHPAAATKANGYAFVGCTNLDCQMHGISAKSLDVALRVWNSISKRTESINPTEGHA